MNQPSEKIQSQFYAQYLGQKVLRHSDYKKDDECMEIQYVHLSDDWMRHYLLLRKVEQLTDEEAHILMQIAFYHPDNELIDAKECGAGDGDYNLDGSWWLEASCRCWNGALGVTPLLGFTLTDEDDKCEVVYNTIGCIDYLRSIGILLPFTYLKDGNPKTLTPEQLIEFGWVRVLE